MQFINISCYKFVPLVESELPELRQQLKARAVAAELKGTILLSPEGINLFLAGLREAIDGFRAYLAQWPEFANLWCKESVSDHQPFTRMLVRLKKEIIAFGRDEIKPDRATAPYVSPETLKAWYDNNKDMVVLDTRNDYEIELGSFENAVDLNLKHFRHFPDAITELPESMKDKTIVTYCTGGIRCEKAAAWMLQKGFKNVYQLEGGILNYFEKCGDSHYQGECFVFDKRVALDPRLQETSTQQCYACRAAVPLAKQGTQATQCPSCGEAGSIG